MRAHSHLAVRRCKDKAIADYSNQSINHLAVRRCKDKAIADYSKDAAHLHGLSKGCLRLMRVGNEGEGEG